tara:strand:+ start:723 stop:2309 length:1587 start_codon:yes stop_codon:yes gene_type:complete
MQFGSPQGNLPTTTTKDFSRGPTADIRRSTFNRSHGLKTTLNADNLVPIFTDEVLPGDTFQINTHGFGRLATPIHPYIDNMYIETFFFYCPYRLVWDNFQKFMGEKDNPGDSIDYLIPQIEDTSVAEGSLFDYFGIVPGKTLSFNNLVGRSHNLVFNTWFRDQNTQDSLVVDRDDGPDDIADYVIVKRNKRHNYFTSALPTPQSGDAVDLPLGTTAPIKYDMFVDGSTNNANNQFVVNQAVSTDGDLRGRYGATLGVDTGPLDDNSKSNLVADLSNASSATINQLREAFQLQAFLEKENRGGSRYKEMIYSMFGVLTGDARLDRPEYLGGGRSRITVQPVPQTSSTDSTTPQGNVSGYGYMAFSDHKASKSFTEHGCIIGLANIYADQTFGQGIDRSWFRRDRYDLYWPAFAHLGEQSILNKEIYAQGNADDEETFGFQERYAEYRYKPSMLTGKMRSNVTGSLDTWHLAQDFASKPELNSSFITSNTPVDRVIAVTDEPQFILDLYFDLKSTRPMPVYGTPLSLSRF